MIAGEGSFIGQSKQGEGLMCTWIHICVLFFYSCGFFRLHAIGMRIKPGGCAHFVGQSKQGVTKNVHMIYICISDSCMGQTV